jgi:hypothetical protein
MYDSRKGAGGSIAISREEMDALTNDRINKVFVKLPKFMRA